MTTKEKFLKDIKEVMDKYRVYFSYVETNGIPSGTINNIPNYGITAFKVEVPKEDMYTYVSGKEFVDYMCNETK